MPGTPTRFSALLSLLPAIGAHPAVGCPALPQEQELRASDPATRDEFGYSLAVDGDVLVIGARYCDVLGVDSGAAYVFRYTGPGWQEEQKLTAPDGVADDLFGSSVSVSGDAVLIGAMQDTGSLDKSGSAYVFREGAGGWTFEQKLIPEDEQWYGMVGASVSLKGDLAVVGAANYDAAYVYRHDGVQWNPEAKLVPSSGATRIEFGRAVAASDSAILVGARRDFNDHGKTYVFNRTGSTWSEDQILSLSDGDSGDFFGAAVALDDDLAIVGSPGHEFGGNQSIGAAFIYRHDGNAWVEERELFPADITQVDEFGDSVAIRGDTAVVGSPRSDLTDIDDGAAYVFRHNTIDWVENARLAASDGVREDLFGTSVAVDEDTAYTGAPRHNDGVRDSGSAYVHAITNLTLVASPNIVSAGDTLTLTTRGGLTGGRAFVALVNANGSPFFLRLAGGPFDTAGEWSFGGTIPAGLAGLVVQFQSYGVYQTSKIGSSGRATVTFL